MFRRFVITSGIVLALASSVGAAKFAGDAFTLGVGGRGLALGGAVIAGPFDATAPYWNPAGMASLGDRQVVAMHAETFGSLLNHDFVAYVDARDRGNSLVKAFAFYLYYLGGGGIKITSLNEFNRPYVVREESHGDYLLAASIAGTLTAKLDFGLTAKVIYRDIGTESGKGLTADIGLIYRYNRNLHLGLTVTDFTTGFIRYSGDTFDRGSNSESIYPTVKPGLMLQVQRNEFQGRFSMSGDIRFEGIKGAAQYWSKEISMDTHFGWELVYKGAVAGRAGFDIGRFTAGGGVNVRKLSIDFAYLHHDELEETFRVSAAYRF